jgi:hypothetical protein
MKRLFFCVFLLAATCAAAFGQGGVKPAKLSVDEIVARHLASLGSAEARSKVTSRVFVGEGRLNGKIGFVGMLNGPAQLASDGRKVLLAMVLNGADYPYEKVGFDGKNLSVGKPDGRFTILAEFLRSQSAIVKDGLFTGVLSSAWPFLDHGGKAPKFEAAGTEELGGRWFYKLRSSHGDLNVELLFDANSFRHVASRYEYTIAPRMSTEITETPKEKPSRFTMSEQFSDFKVFGGLTLPSKYTIDISNEADGSLTQIQWSVNVQKAFFNQSLEESAFKVS